MAWEWVMLDIAYTMLVIGGAAIFRMRRASPATWTSYGILSALVGGFLFRATFQTQQIMASMSTNVTAGALFTGC